MQIANTDFEIVVETLQEWMHWNTKSMSEIFFKKQQFYLLGAPGMAPDWVHAIPPALGHEAHPFAPVARG
jgi:hypothetical protein